MGEENTTIDNKEAEAELDHDVKEENRVSITEIDDPSWFDGPEDLTTQTVIQNK